MEKQTVISKDIRFRGSLRFDNIVRIDGVFQGTIESKGDLIIGATGEVDADIKTNNIEIYGKLKGNIHATNKVSLRRNSYLRGDILCKELEIEAGSKFIGSCMME